MKKLDDEDTLLRSVALQNANSILHARQRAEEELVRAKEELELKTKELAHSLAMIRATLESTTDAILVTDAGGKVTGFNQKYLAMWQIPPEVMETRDHRQLLEVCSRQFSDAPKFRAKVEQIYTASPPESFDLLDLADGRVFERFSRLQFADERNAGRVWSFRDITERRRAEEARRYLSAVVDSSDDAIVTKNLDGVIRSWNAGAQRIFGYAPQEVIGKPITILLPADRLHEEEGILRRLQQGERVDHFETVRVHKQGRLLDISVTISPIRDSSGQVVGASKIARDISDRKQGERTTRFLADASAALAELTDNESTLQKVASLAVPHFADWCAVDIQETDGSVRRLAVRHTDDSKMNLAHDLERRYPPQPSDKHGLMKVLRSGESDWAAEVSEALLTDLARDQDHLQLLRDLGLKSYVCVPLRSRNMTLGALTFVATETRRSYNTDDLRAAEDLAHRAVIAIENANLLSALKESDRRKDEFLAILAHELRNPLAPIRNAVEIIRAKGPPLPELQWARDVIDRQVVQMTRLVDDLLDVSRITRGKVELRKERVQLATIIHSAVEASRPLIEKWGHGLSVTLPPEPIYLEADPIRLAQVLLNLLNNAAKYTEQGGRIWLTGAQAGDYVLLRVKDTGVGIPAEMLPRIFDMFTQVNRSLERSQGGLGIGLALVRRLVELHGGTVEALSEGPGKGSEFLVRLPLAGEVKRREPQGTDADAGKIAAPLKCRILVVDDNKDAADSLGMLLRLMGNEVRTAHDGLEAVGAATVFRPDIVLMDIGLPKLNGHEAARRMRGERGGDITLIALTGWGQEEDRLRSKEAGFDHHLTKPVDLAALQKLLADLALAK